MGGRTTEPRAGGAVELADVGGAGSVLEAAQRVEATIEAGLSPSQRATAEDHLSEWLVFTTDPRLPTPLLRRLPPVARRVHDMLVVAGGAPLDHAAGWLADRVGVAAPLATVADLLQEALPASSVSELAAQLTRRVVCDRAGLVVTRHAPVVVAVDALDDFVRAAMGRADDAGLIDETALAAAGTGRGWGEHLGDLIAVCGFERIFGRLAVRHNRASATRAALLDLARPATAHEIADRTGYDANLDVATVFSTYGSIEAVSSGRWAAHPDERFVAFVRAARRLADVDGIIDTEELAVAAAEGGFADQLEGFVEYVGYARHGDLISVADSAVAVVKAALVAAGDCMTVTDVAVAAGLSVEAAHRALLDCKGARYDRAKRRWRAVTPPATTKRGAALRRDPVLGVFVDDVGLIDEGCLRQATASTAALESLAEQHDLAIVSGRLAIGDTLAARVKATLLNLGRAASTGELATLIGLNPKAVSRSIETIDSIIATPAQRWVVDTGDGALRAFAAAAAVCCDDSDLIDENRLRRITANHLNHSFEQLVASLGLVRVGGRLAARDTAKARITAAILDLDRPATTAEIAQHCGSDVMATSIKLAVADSVLPVKRNPRSASQVAGAAVWVAETAGGGVYREFAAALELCSDDVGLINETQLELIAAERNWPIPLPDLIEACHLTRLSKHLAMSDTATAAAKAVLLAEGPASIKDLAEASGHLYSAIANGFARRESIRRISRGKRSAPGRFDADPPASFLVPFLTP